MSGKRSGYAIYDAERDRWFVGWQYVEPGVHEASWIHEMDPGTIWIHTEWKTVATVAMLAGGKAVYVEFQEE